MADVARLGAGIPLVARRTEMRTLREVLRRAAGGEAVGLLVSGDAGVGKSRLTAEVGALARAEGYVVLTGRCLDTAEAALPYLPFAEVTRGLAEHDAQLIDNHVALRRLLPDHHPHAATAGEDRNLGQLQLFDALFAVLGEASLQQPVVVVVEDLHWADKSSRDLLSFLLARLSRQRLLLVGTLRSDDLHRRHPLRPLLAELVRLPAVERLHVDPFTPSDAETYVRTLADSLPDDVVHNIAARSEGNAFMAEELVSASSDQVPQELAEVLLARVESLSPATQQVMRLASVLGRRFTHERLSAAAAVAPADLDDALREAVAHNVLVTEGSAEAYAFRHALLREAVYADLLPGERSRLHGDAARALAGDTSQGAAAALAHHSMESHDLPGALAASVLAAREADDIGAPAEMLVHTERALQLWCAVGDAERASGTDELALTRWAARAAAASGEPDRAIAHSRSAIELVDRGGDALEAADVRRKYAHYLFTLDGYEQRAYDTSYEAWQLVADSEPSETKAWTQAGLARSLASLGRYDEAGERAEAAMQTARAIPGAGPPTAAEADALITRTICIDRKRGSLDRALELLSEAADLAAKAEARDVELRARFARATSLMDEGHLGDALTEVDSAVERAASIGLTWSAYGLELRVRQVIIRFMTGDWDGAQAAAELAGASVSGTVITRVSAAGMLVLVGRGRFDVADRRLERLGQRWRVDQQVMTLVGTCGAELECWRGRPAQAAEYVEQALDRLRRNAPWHLVALSLCALGVSAYADIADAARQGHDATAEQEAVAAGEAITEHAEQTLARGRPDSREVGPEGRAWFARVQAETSRLRGERDPALWRAVVDAFGYGETYRQAHARWRLAETLLSGPGEHDRDQAAHQLRQAVQAGEALGAVPLQQAVEGLARRARIGLGGSRPVTSAGPLTPRESAVLSLVAAGRTNRQIGAELFISEKTVSVHLSRAMAKLGAGSRTEAVSAAYARGLLTPAVSAP